MSGMKCRNCAAPTASYFDFSVSLFWSSISSIWRLVGAFSTSTANGLLSSSNLHFWTSKSANCRVNSAQSMLSFFSKLCTWEHGGRDLRFHGLAAGEMAQVSLQHLILPQAQFSFKSPHCSIHVCDDTPPPLKLQVQHIEMAREVTQKGQLTQKLLLPELCCVFTFAFQKLTYFLTQLETPFQYFSSA